MSNDRRLIYRYRRSPSRPRTSNREVINELEEHNAVLHAINESLRTELANVEQRNRQLMSDRSTLREREISYLNEMDRLAERRDRAEARAEDVEERIRLMRRVFTGSERMLRQRLEERVERLEDLIRVMDDQINSARRCLGDRHIRIHIEEF